jgi:hypothetical protein
MDIAYVYFHSFGIRKVVFFKALMELLLEIKLKGLGMNPHNISCENKSRVYYESSRVEKSDLGLSN